MAAGGAVGDIDLERKGGKRGGFFFLPKCGETKFFGAGEK